MKNLVLKKHGIHISNANRPTGNFIFGCSLWRNNVKMKVKFQYNVAKKIHTCSRFCRKENSSVKYGSYSIWCLQFITKTNHSFLVYNNRTPFHYIPAAIKFHFTPCLHNTINKSGNSLTKEHFPLGELIFIKKNHFSQKENRSPYIKAHQSKTERFRSCMFSEEALGTFCKTYGVN